MGSPWDVPGAFSTVRDLRYSAGGGGVKRKVGDEQIAGLAGPGPGIIPRMNESDFGQLPAAACPDPNDEPLREV